MENRFNYISVVEQLIRKNISITAMESCTGGLVQSMLTDVEGVSAIFKGGYVAYSNDTKIKLGVPAGIISQYGVYSAECAAAMAQTAQKLSGADISIGITGSTGNTDPNNSDSMVGEVYFCIITDSTPHGFYYKTDVAGKRRDEIKQEYANKVMEELGRLL